MACYQIRYYLYRSNPVILREMKIPTNLTVKAMIAVICLGVGIQAQKGEFRRDGEEVAEEDLLISEVFEPNGEFAPVKGSLTIYQDIATREVASLTFRYEISEKSEEVLESPLLVQGAGYCIPQKLFVIGTMNEIMQEFVSKKDTVNLPGVGEFIEASYRFQMKKVQNYLYSYFMPEKAAIIKNELAVPLKTILESRTLSDLTWIADYHRVYTSQKRKNDYVEELHSRLSKVPSKVIFEDMDILEYENFKTLVLTGKTNCTDNDMIFDVFPTLSTYGMISITKKHGPLLASGILLDYETWFDQEKERIYRCYKRIHMVIKGCCYFYGVFSKERCEAVLHARYPGEVTKEDLDRFWNDPPAYSVREALYPVTNKEEVPFAQEFHLFLNPNEASRYYNAITVESESFYMPTREELEQLTLEDWYSFTPFYTELKDYIKRKMYFYYDKHDIILGALRSVRLGESTEKVVKKNIRVCKL